MLTARTPVVKHDRGSGVGAAAGRRGEFSIVRLNVPSGVTVNVNWRWQTGRILDRESIDAVERSVERSGVSQVLSSAAGSGGGPASCARRSSGDVDSAPGRGRGMDSESPRARASAAPERRSAYAHARGGGASGRRWRSHPVGRAFSLGSASP
jgi:hypothetical protein